MAPCQEAAPPLLVSRRWRVGSNPWAAAEAPLFLSTLVADPAEEAPLFLSTLSRLAMVADAAAEVVSSALSRLVQ